VAVSDCADSGTQCAVRGRPARIAEGYISTFPRFLTLKLLPFSAPPGGSTLFNPPCRWGTHFQFTGVIRDSNDASYELCLAHDRREMRSRFDRMARYEAAV
jgi:hypothetical protein